ncbi:carboxypeptidase-like regulatory domain-containing protein [Desulfosarcina variabilis]|uniref:carboxypeptidase-like regulatory domain-containing protein n=1 Tax=Desulfosarcina variabilis TaxID=2300 RepID=UPI003AFA33C6
MIIHRLMIVMMAMVWMFLFATGDLAYAGGWLLGDISLVEGTGKHTYGQYISVFLTRKAIAVPRDPALNSMERHRRLDRINQMHMDFFKTFSQYRGRPDYLIAHAESSDTGNFAFLDVPAGDYYVVVTFPAMIGGYKVAWQQPVTIKPGRPAYVSLNDDNLALPTDRRN